MPDCWTTYIASSPGRQARSTGLSNEPTSVSTTAGSPPVWAAVRRRGGGRAGCGRRRRRRLGRPATVARRAGRSGGRTGAVLGATTVAAVGRWRRRRSSSSAQAPTASTDRRGDDDAAAPRHRPTRARPSCTTLTTSVPSAVKIAPPASPRAAPGRERVLVVEQPLVGAERAVEPHRVVEARHLHPRAVPRQAERQHGRVEQRHVAGVRHDARVDDRVVGQVAVGPQPDPLAVGRRALAAERVAVDVAHVDRPGPVVPARPSGPCTAPSACASRAASRVPARRAASPAGGRGRARACGSSPGG